MPISIGVFDVLVVWQRLPFRKQSVAYSIVCDSAKSLHKLWAKAHHRHRFGDGQSVSITVCLLWFASPFGPAKKHQSVLFGLTHQLLGSSAYALLSLSSLFLSLSSSSAQTPVVVDPHAPSGAQHIFRSLLCGGKRRRMGAWVFHVSVPVSVCVCLLCMSIQ